MGAGQLLTPWAVFFLALGFFQSVVNAQITTKVTNNSLVILTPNSTIQVYPPVNVQPTDWCPDAPWKHWLLYTAPPDFDPLNWSRSQWQHYITQYPLRSSGLSLAFFLIGLGSLLVALVWRLVQWCVSCGHCRRACGVHTGDTGFLKDTKHRYLKAWIYLLVAGGLGMVVWGMLAMDRTLIDTFWDAFAAAMQYGQDVSDDLQELQTGITRDVPAQLRATAATVNGTIDSTRLGALVQASMQFNNDTKAAARGLLVNATSLSAGVAAGVLPGTAALAQLYGKPIAAASEARRRRLAQSSSTSSSSLYDTLYGLLPALRDQMPAVVGADSTRTNIQARMQALLSALAPFVSGPSPVPSSSELAALAEALNQTTLGLWEGQLDAVAGGLQVYNASRSGPALGAAKDAADRILSGSGQLAPSAVAGMQARVMALSRQMVPSPPYVGLKGLRTHLLNISAEVTPSVDKWRVSLGNGTKMGILDVTTFLLVSLSDHITSDTATGVSTADTAAINGSRGGAVNVSTFILVAGKASSAVVDLNASAASVAAAAASGGDAASGGPDPAAAATQISSVLGPSLTAAADPVAAVAAALKTYGSNPNAANLATLRAAASAADGPVGAAAGAFASPLVDGAALASACQSLYDAAGVLQDVSSSYTSTAVSYKYGNLTLWSTAMSSYQTGLGQLVALLGQLPDPSEAKDAVAGVAGEVQDVVFDVLDDIQAKVAAAADGLQSALDGLQDKLLSPGNKAIQKLRGRTDDISRIAYPVAMGAWGLGALLLLGLALSVHRNWPGGLVGFGLVLLAYITLSQVVTSALAFALAVVGDACSSAELVMMRQMVEHSSDPKMAVPLSFYMYKVPPTSEVMLQAAFGVNVTDVRLRLESINSTLTDRIDRLVVLRGATLGLVSSLRSLGTSTRDLFNGIVTMLRYETVHMLYGNTKDAVCCNAGSFAYHEWCAITAAAALSFGALISGAYLLLRMDLVVQRREGCCSCCSCACYRPRGRYAEGEDPEAGEEDKFAKAARKQHQEHHLPHQHHQSLQNPKVGPGAGPGSGNTSSGGSGQFYGVAVGGHGGGRPADWSPLPPSGLSAAAGGAAAAGGPQSADPHYSAPSAPAMTAGRQQA